ncbi:hypothetical protein Tco_0180871 [Tanacetum coccineum]
MDGFVCVHAYGGPETLRARGALEVNHVDGLEWDTWMEREVVLGVGDFDGITIHVGTLFPRRGFDRPCAGVREVVEDQVDLDGNPVELGGLEGRSARWALEAMVLGWYVGVIAGWARDYCY